MNCVGVSVNVGAVSLLPNGVRSTKIEQLASHGSGRSCWSDSMLCARVPLRLITWNKGGARVFKVQRFAKALLLMATVRQTSWSAPARKSVVYVRFKVHDMAGAVLSLPAC